MNTSSCLCLRLYGPMQSWGTESQFERRTTRTMPSRSAIAGLLCAALGYPRGSTNEETFLRNFHKVHMRTLSVQVPTGNDSVMDDSTDKATSGVTRPYEAKYGPTMIRIRDFHTIQQSRRASGGINNNAVITTRYYLNDAKFLVFLTGERELLEPWSKALTNPVWGVFLGRKCCIPSVPVYAGCYSSLHEAEEALTKGLSIYEMEEDCTNFDEKTDTLMDCPLCFSSDARGFAPRLIRRGKWERK